MSFHFRLCDDYEEIAEKALTTPSNTEELMQLKAYIEKVQSDTIFVMEKRLMASKDRLAFLSDYAQFNPAEIRLNAQVFTWHTRMPAVFEEHVLIVSEKTNQYEEALKVILLLVLLLLLLWLLLPTSMRRHSRYTYRISNELSFITKFIT